MSKVEDIKVKIFADGADKNTMLEMYQRPLIKGLTTNPSLMRKAGITDYEAFSKDILKSITDKSLSLEVFSDDLEEMKRQALMISTWGDNVYVKIPVTNTKGQSTEGLVSELSDNGVKLNVTAIMTNEQVKNVVQSLNPDVEAYVSVFAGRIADTGIDPVPVMKESVEITGMRPKAEVIWASPRELYNIFQADQVGCQVITVTESFLKKLDFVGYDLNQYSLDTVKMFYEDALEAGYKL
ncbi:transaldolase [Verrucomicrobiales bacterium]|nr:transaldolase [Verrucomicrobiales bacterium]